MSHADHWHTNSLLVQCIMMMFVMLCIKPNMFDGIKFANGCASQLTSLLNTADSLHKALSVEVPVQAIAREWALLACDTWCDRSVAAAVPSCIDVHLQIPWCLRNRGQHVGTDVHLCMLVQLCMLMPPNSSGPMTAAPWQNWCAANRSDCHRPAPPTFAVHLATAGVGADDKLECACSMTGKTSPAPTAAESILYPAAAGQLPPPQAPASAGQITCAAMTLTYQADLRVVAAAITPLCTDGGPTLVLWSTAAKLCTRRLAQLTITCPVVHPAAFAVYLDMACCLYSWWCSWWWSCWCRGSWHHQPGPPHR